jgi:Radical SAM superfamily
MTSSRWKLSDHPYVQKKAFVAPLSLATIAALTPKPHVTHIWDEAVHGLIDEETVFESQYDLVGVGGYITSIFRAKEVAKVFRARSIPVVAGGAGVTASPEQYADAFDVMILGESERIWPRFLEAFATGTRSGVFQDPETVEMTATPPPDWRNLAGELATSYAVGGVQTTRGCPFVCEFCNVWKVFGRRMRTKPVAQVVAEIETLERNGVRVIDFCEDNFYGARKYCKEILAQLISLNERFCESLHYYAEISINIARDDEVLELLSRAGFAGLFIGVESPNVASLEESAKVQNLKGDLVETCRKIQSYGLPIEASMIVGFDHDDITIFDQHHDFFVAANIALPRVRMLQARPGTETYHKLIAAGRVLDEAALHEPGTFFDNYLIPNIVPLQITRLELFERYIALMERTLDWDSFTQRMLGYLHGITYEPARRRNSGAARAKMPEDLRTYVESLEPRVRGHVLEILATTASQAPNQLHSVVTLIVRQSIEVQNLGLTKESIERQIAFERDLDLEGCLYASHGSR